jgi:hypothetical protein
MAKVSPGRTSLSIISSRSTNYLLKTLHIPLPCTTLPAAELVTALKEGPPRELGSLQDRLQLEILATNYLALMVVGWGKS